MHKYQEMVYAYAFQKVRNEADAQDITQEIFLQAYRHLYQLRHPHLFRSWLYTVMSNECKRWLMRVVKKRRNEVVLEEAADEALQIDPPHTVPVEGWQVDLEQAISALSDENRVAVSMFYMGDCTLKEISEFLGVSVNTVKGKLHRARQQLGAAMSQHYGRQLKSHKLKGGFLMQMMEQLRHTPMATMGFAWSGATIGKTVFSLIAALCILIGLIGGRNDSLTELPLNQTEVAPAGTSRWPIEVALLASAPYSARSPITGIPEPTGKRPLVASSHASTESGRNSTNGAPMPHGGGAENPNAQFSDAMAEYAAEKLTYSGRVVNVDGEPVEGAEILYAVNWRRTKLGRRTTADGAFRFEVPRPQPRKWEGRLDIVVTHSDYANLWRKLSLKDTENVEIQLDAPGTIAGRVMNEAGEPIPSAEATIQFTVGGDALSPRIGDYEDYTMLEIFHRTPPAKTDENGEFAFRNLPTRATPVLYVEGPGYAQTKHMLVPVGRQDLKFRLKREARIEGRLSYAETGEPVVNAKVDLRSADTFDGSWSASVDEDGDYVLNNLGPGTYNLFLDFIDKGPEGWTAAARQGIKVAEGQTVSNMDLSLIRCGLITGRASDKDTDEPLRGVIIYFHDAARPESQISRHSAEPDETGVYRFHAAPGRVLVMASAPLGYQGIGEVRRYVDVVEGGSVTVDFQFSTGLELVVRTLTEDGEPVPSIPIGLSQWDDKLGFVGTNVAVTDSDGRYRGVKLIVGEEYMINVIPTFPPTEEYFAATTGQFTATRELTQLADLVLSKIPPDQITKHQAWETRAQEVEQRFETLVGKTAPELAVAEWLSGPAVSIGDLKGKTVVLHFWELAYWDGGNLLWIRLLNGLQETYREKGLVCVAICSATAKVDRVKRYIAEQSITYSVGLDRPTEVDGAKGKTFDRYAVWSSNTVVLINPTGEVSDMVYRSNLENRIKVLLGD